MKRQFPRASNRSYISIGLCVEADIHDSLNKETGTKDSFLIVDTLFFNGKQHRLSSSKSLRSTEAVGHECIKQYSNRTYLLNYPPVAT